MLFFGLDLMHQNVAPMADEAWFADLLAWTDGSYLFGFVIGCVLSFIVQSSVAVTAVVLAFQGAGVFGAGETLMIVYGANVGSSMLTLAPTTSLRGQAKQIAMYQPSYTVLADVILVQLLYVEVWTGVPLIDRKTAV